MGLGRNIGNLLVAQIALSVPSILQQRSLDLLSPQNCTKSSFEVVWNVSPLRMDIRSDQSLLHSHRTELEAYIAAVAMRMVDRVLEDFQFLRGSILRLSLRGNGNAIVHGIPVQDVLVVGPLWRNSNRLQQALLLCLAYERLHVDWAYRNRSKCRACRSTTTASA